MTAAPPDLEALFRAGHARLLAGLVRRLGDLELAEDALQEAWLAAASSWGGGAERPEDPLALLATMALRRGLDALRSLSRRTRLEEDPRLRERLARRAEPAAASPALGDERLALVCACSHPALDAAVRVPLTLNALGGLTIAEVARAFLSGEAAMARRLQRAKAKIRDAGIPFRVPAPEAAASRLEDVREVVLLVFNEGFSPTAGREAVRPELCAEALHLGRALDAAFPADAETEALVALMLLKEARRGARLDAQGRFLRLAEQDRGRFDRGRIAEGRRWLDRALDRGRGGALQIQAAIAALHVEAETAESIDWPQILLLYDLLLRHRDTPVIRLNRAVALAEVGGPQAALAAVEALSIGQGLGDYLYLHATRAELLERLGRREEALEAWRRGRSLARNAVEQAFLEGRMARLEG